MNDFALEWAAYETASGWGGVAQSRSGIYGHILPIGDRALLEAAVAERWGAIKRVGRLDIVDEIGAYFAGRKVDFTHVPLDFSEFHDFDRLVYIAASKIPYGSLATYGELADLAGFPGAARAVGNAMAKNRLPLLVPCHRVVRSDRSLGGWSGAIGWKERLLCREGITITDGRVPLRGASTGGAG